jgi:ABC-type Fe3+-siderophore transport system permease subunit
MAGESPTSLKSPLPQGYRQGLVTAISVLLGFSLTFMRFWGIESPGKWTWKGILVASVLGAGILVQLFALWRSLELGDDEAPRYTGTVRWFFIGVGIVVLGVIVAIIVAA